jgi:ketosteroid isomerase-like protein
MNGSISLRTSALFIAALGLLVVNALGQEQSSAAAGDSAAAAAVKEQEQQLANALASGKVEQVRKLLAAEYRATDPLGHVAGADALFQSLQNNTFSVKSAKLGETTVDVFGDAAVARGILSITGQWGEQDISGDFRFTDTWIKRDGQWLLVASQYTRLAAE